MRIFLVLLVFTVESLGKQSGRKRKMLFEAMHLKVVIIISWPGNALAFSQWSWKSWLLEGISGLPDPSCCPRDPTLEQADDNGFIGFIEHQAGEKSYKEV
ncbi:hypothetical protein CHARACLAT_026481 [Characodon lateralis]|uniref:Uncharacterized protein n=1 Tax=Characodon lateralis TaxID=208331 RepID=A0ABU7E3N6_9TELE|nr:hypothetical protein [Characodon lateralis]